MILEQDLIELYKSEYPNDYTNIVDGLKTLKYETIRINTLKDSKENILKKLDESNVKYHKSNISEYTYIIDELPIDFKESNIYKDGLIYFQSISSQIPPLVLDLKDGIDVLDMCAAPGGKTSFISELNSKTRIMACETNKIRSERLKYNLNLLGVKNASLMVVDARKLDSFFRFDTILLDAPCSGSGTINFKENDLKNFSKELVYNSAKLQKQLLKKAIEVLKVNSTMVYSTCSILKEENEEVIKSVLGNNVILEDININIDKSNLLPSTLDKVLTIKPSKEYEGFFIAKLRKVK